MSMKARATTRRIGVVIVAGLVVTLAATASAWRVQAPRAKGVTARVTSNAITIENDLVAATWPIADGRIGDGTWSSASAGTAPARLGSPFRIALAAGAAVGAAEMTIDGPPRIEDLAANGGSPRLVDRFPGKQIVVSFSSASIAGPVTWRAVLRQGSGYVRTELTIGPVKTDLPVTSVSLVALQAAGARVDGTVQGSPAVT